MVILLLELLKHPSERSMDHSAVAMLIELSSGPITAKKLPPGVQRESKVERYTLAATSSTAFRRLLQTHGRIICATARRQGCVTRVADRES